MKPKKISSSRVPIRLSFRLSPYYSGITFNWCYSSITLFWKSFDPSFILGMKTIKMQLKICIPSSWLRLQSAFIRFCDFRVKIVLNTSEEKFGAKPIGDLKKRVRGMGGEIRGAPRKIKKLFQWKIEIQSCSWKKDGWQLSYSIKLDETCAITVRCITTHIQSIN